MKRLPAGLLLVLVLTWAAPAPAQWIFAKKQKVIPTQRVPELVLIVKTDPDERKRQHAAEELRDYDVTTFTEIVPVLVDVLRNEKKMNVRYEALASLAKIRPVTTLAGQAIEKAATDDESWRIRLQAKTSLPKYYLSGYSAKKGEATPVKKKTTDEPPLTVPQVPAISTAFPRPLPPGVAAPTKTTPPPVKSPSPPVQGPSLFP